MTAMTANNLPPCGFVPMLAATDNRAGSLAPAGRSATDPPTVAPASAALPAVSLGYGQYALNHTLWFDAASRRLRL